MVTRSRLRTFHVQDFRAALLSPMRRELRAIEDVMAGGIGELDAWLDIYYPDHREALAADVRPLVRKYGGLVVGAALEEVDEGGASVATAAFADEYSATIAQRWTDSSVAQIRQIIRDEAEPLDVVEARLAKWGETRHVWSGEREATQAGGAFAKLAYLAVGVERLVWRTVAPCDLCAPMEGRTVSITSTFLAEGDTVEPTGDANPLTVTRSIGHPPLHGMGGRGGVCQCMVAAA